MTKKIKPAIRLFLCMNLIAIGVLTYSSKYMTIQEKEKINELRQMGLFPRDMIEVKLEENKVQEEYNKMVENKKQEIADYLGSKEYKKREMIKDLRKQTGLNITGYREYTFEISYYTDLVCENSKYGNVTATGEILTNGMVANNILPFGTKVLIEGHGIKTVKDRGSQRYFGSIEKFDVFVPRNNGESSSDYYKRINNMGRKHVTGYILEVSE